MVCHPAGQGCIVRVAMVVGRDEPRRDGVADHVRQLASALEAEVDIVPAAGRVGAAARELARLRPDVVHVHWAPAAYGYRPTLGLLPALITAPLVVTLHEYGWWAWPARLPEALWAPLGRVWDRETGRLALRARAVVTTNAGHADALRTRTGVSATVLPLAGHVPVVPADPAATRARWHVPAGAPLVVFFGFVHPVKGVRWLLRALRESTHPDLHLVVAGGFDTLALPRSQASDFEAELRADAAALGVADRVRFTGWLDPAAVSALLQAADVAVLPFTHGLSLKSSSLLAVQDHGVPLVGTAGPDTPTALHAEALLGPVRESTVLAANLDRALAGGAPRVRRTGTSWPELAAKHLALYRAAA